MIDDGYNRYPSKSKVLLPHQANIRMVAERSLMYMTHNRIAVVGKLFSIVSAKLEVIDLHGDIFFKDKP